MDLITPPTSLHCLFDRGDPPRYFLLQSLNIFLLQRVAATRLLDSAVRTWLTSSAKDSIAYPTANRIISTIASHIVCTRIHDDGQRLF
jgi:hypothetical protein